MAEKTYYDIIGISAEENYMLVDLITSEFKTSESLDEVINKLIKRSENDDVFRKFLIVIAGIKFSELLTSNFTISGGIH